MIKAKFIVFLAFFSLAMGTYLSLFAYKQMNTYKTQAACGANNEGGCNLTDYQKALNKADPKNADNDMSGVGMDPNSPEFKELLLAQQDFKVGALTKEQLNKIEEKLADKYSKDPKYGDVDKIKKEIQDLQKLTKNGTANLKTDPNDPALQTARQQCIGAAVGAKDCYCYHTGDHQAVAEISCIVIN